MTRLNCVPDCLYEARGRGVRDEIPGELLERVCVHLQQEPDLFPSVW